MRFSASRAIPPALAAGLVAALAAAPLAAAPPPQPVKAEGRAQELQKLLDCRKIADNTQRLACFDAASAAMDQAEVEAVRQNGAGKWVIRLEDGATWTQVDSNDITPDPKIGEEVEIRRAALGSYMLVLPHHRSFRAHREQ